MDENKKVKRVGTLTLAITFIIFGVIMILQMFLKFDILRYILMLWPAVFILLGIEILAFNIKKDTSIKYDAGSIFLIFVLVGISCVVGILNYGINDFLYKDSVKNSLIEKSTYNTHTYRFENMVNIDNVSDKKIKLKIEEVSSAKEDEIIFITNSQFDKDKISVLNLIDNNMEYEMFNVNYDKDENVNLIITYIPDIIKEYTIKVIVSDKDKIKINQNSNIEIIHK